MMKIARPNSAGMPGQTVKPKSGDVLDAGAFSKLLSSVNMEKQETENASTENPLAKIEEAIELLEQVPVEELPREQQELLGTIIELLLLQAAQVNLSEQKTSLSNELPENPVQHDPANAYALTEGALERRMVELVQQIAQKVQEMQASSLKEFVDIPIFVGVEMEYILEEPKKVNKMIEVLEDVISRLKVAQIEGPLHQVDELMAEEKPASVQNTESPTEIPVKGSAETIPQTGTAKPEGALSTPMIRMANLAEDFGGILKNAKLAGTGDHAQIKVSIFPEHLGQLEIRLSTVDGKVAAQIFTSSLVAKEALELQIHQLRSAMLQQGITVDRIEISQQPASQSFNQQQEQRFTQQKSQQRQVLQKNGYQQLEEEAAAIVRPADSGSQVMSVDYTI